MPSLLTYKGRRYEPIRTYCIEFIPSCQDSDVATPVKILERVNANNASSYKVFDVAKDDFKWQTEKRLRHQDHMVHLACISL